MPRLAVSKRAAIKAALKLQSFAVSGAELLAQDLRECPDKEQRARIATAQGNLMRAWTGLADSVRVLKGDPLPGSLKPEQNKPKNKTHRASGTLDVDHWEEPSVPGPSTARPGCIAAPREPN